MKNRIVTPELPRITRAEFLERQDRVRRLAEDRGYSALLVWARGASTQDQYADVYYLSNFYSHYPAVPDADGRWSAKGYAGLVIPVDGPITLVTDLAGFREDLTVADHVDSDQDVVGAAIAAIRRDAGGTGRIGVLGSPALSWRWMDRLRQELGNRFVVADDIGPILRLVKSSAEQELLRAAGRVGVLAVEAMMDAAVPGVTEAEMAAAGFEAVVSAGGMVYGLSLSAGPTAHTYGQSQPAVYDSRRELQKGEMARVDMYGSVDGYLFDFGRSRVVGQEPSIEQRMMLDGAREPVLAGIDQVRPGATVGDIARACQRVFQETAFTRSGRALPPEFFSWGHSLGLNWEAPYIDADNDMILEAGMCLAVEKRTALPGVGGATHEDNILVTEGGYELLTPARVHYDSGL